MADEITVGVNISVAKGELSESQSFSGAFDLSASPVYIGGGVQNIGTAAHEALVVGDVASAGWAYFQNLDTTNYVEIGVDGTGTFYPLVKLLAGEFCILRLATAAPYAKANTAAVALKYRVFSA